MSRCEPTDQQYDTPAEYRAKHRQPSQLEQQNQAIALQELHLDFPCKHS